jgi:hypothetical protein
MGRACSTNEKFIQNCTRKCWKVSETMARTFVNVVVNEVFDQLSKCRLLEADRVLTNGCRCTTTAVLKDRWCVVVRHNGWPYFRPAALCNTHIHTQRQLPHRLYTTSSTARATGHVKSVSRYTAHEQPLVPHPHVELHATTTRRFAKLAHATRTGTFGVRTDGPTQQWTLDKTQEM